MLSIVGCGRSDFEGLLQLIKNHWHAQCRCGRSDFEGLLQLHRMECHQGRVVEGPVLRDYYNLFSQH